MSQQVAMRHPLSIVFLAHIALEFPVIFQAFWSPTSLPFLGMNNTTLVMAKLLACVSLGSCVTALLCFTLPEYLPGKRAVAIGLTVYHSAVSTVLFQAPRFIPMSFGSLAESYKITYEVAWGTIHGLLSMMFGFWWQATVAQIPAVRKIQ